MDFDVNDVQTGEVHHHEPDRILRENHYLGSAPGPPTKHRYLISGPITTGIIGAAMWGLQAARKLNQDTTIELKRFWTVDGTPKNTESVALSQMMQDMADNGYHRLIAYASAHRHEGTIYKATNWTNRGLRWPSSTWETRDRVMRDGGVKWLYEYVFSDGWYTMNNRRLEVV